MLLLRTVRINFYVCHSDVEIKGHVLLYYNIKAKLFQSRTINLVVFNAITQLPLPIQLFLYYPCISKKRLAVPRITLWAYWHKKLRIRLNTWICLNYLFVLSYSGMCVSAGLKPSQGSICKISIFRTLYASVSVFEGTL